MFLLGTKLHKNQKLILAIKPLHSYGLYRWKFLSKILKYHSATFLGNFSSSNIIVLKYYLWEVFLNIEMDATITHINIQLKKTLQSYQGLWLLLNLPVHGQRTRTNASTQWLLAHNPWWRHFVQKRNRWKFAPKESKRHVIKNKLNERK